MILVAHFRAKFGIAITTRVPLGFDSTTFNPQRKQVSAEKLLQAVRFRYPKLGRDSQARVIAITPLDMYMEQYPQWRFAFSTRSGDDRFAVVSYARMDPQKLGAAPDDALLRSRLRKMITKNIGIIYFGLRGSSNPRSVLYSNVLGVDDLDHMTEDFDPKVARYPPSDLQADLPTWLAAHASFTREEETKRSLSLNKN
jgi:predicted Zn-dependent protease